MITLDLNNSIYVTFKMYIFFFLFNPLPVFPKYLFIFQILKFQFFISFEAIQKVKKKVEQNKTKYISINVTLAYNGLIPEPTCRLC